jgi:hypothetical protein
MKKLLFITLSVMAFSMFIFQSCSNAIDDSNEKSISSEYLKIDNFLTKSSLSKDEKDILLEAQKRINSAVVISDNGALSLGEASPESLGMSEELYNTFQALFAYSNKITISKSTIPRLKVTRLKSEHFESGDVACDYVGEAINACAGNDYEQSLFQKYWKGTGTDTNLSSSRFNDAMSHASTPTSYDDVSINGVSYKRGTVSFYGDDSYDFAFGSANVYYNSQNQPVGFSDTYNFDEGKRSLLPETVTRIVGAFGEACNAKSYKIYYGVHP